MQKDQAVTAGRTPLIITAASLLFVAAIVGYRLMLSPPVAQDNQAELEPGASENPRPLASKGNDVQPAAAMNADSLPPPADVASHQQNVRWDERIVADGIRVRQQVYEDHEGNLVSHGTYTTFYANGKPRNKGQFEHGHRSGPWKFWDKDGNLSSEQHFSDGLRHGSITQFHPNGGQLATGSYWHGAQDGEWLFRDEAGKRIRREHYLRGVPAGMWTHWNAAGEVWLELYRGPKSQEEPTLAEPATKPAP